MRRALLLPLLVACTEARPPMRYRDQVVVRVEVDRPADLERLQALGDVWTEHVVDHALVRLHKRDLSRLGRFSLVLPDVQQAVEQTRRKGQGAPSFWEDWRDLDEIEQHLRDLDDRSPHAEVVVIGTSLEGRDILGLKIVRPSPTGALDRLGMLILGTQHAREWVAASSALWMAERLVDGDGLDPEVDALLDQWRVTIVPVANPDGYAYTWTTDRLWRKNRRDNGDGSFGVDLNRNWDLAWGSAGATTAGSSDNYAGASAFSEPETAAIADYIAARPRMGMVLDLHAFGQLALHPFGATAQPAPDDLALGAAGSEAALDMSALSGSTWSAGPFHTRLYPASGVMIDWAYVAHGANAWLFELRDRSQYGFLLPADQIVPAAEETWAGLLALSAAARPRLHADVDALISGQSGRVRVNRALASSPIEVYTSTTGPGATALSDGTALELDQAVLLGEMTANARGRRALLFAVPWPAGTTVWFQARSGELRSVPQSAVIQ